MLSRLRFLLSGTASAALLSLFAFVCWHVLNEDDNQFGTLLFVLVLGFAVAACSKLLNLDDGIRKTARFLLSGLLFIPVVALLAGTFWGVQRLWEKGEATKQAAEEKAAKAREDADVRSLNEALKDRKSGVKPQPFDSEAFLSDETFKAMDAMVNDWKRREPDPIMKAINRQLKN